MPIEATNKPPPTAPESEEARKLRIAESWRRARLFSCPNHEPCQIPDELRKASERQPGESGRESRSQCHDLLLLGRHDNHKWGFRVYRTTYPRADGTQTNADFDEALHILHSWMRDACFHDYQDAAYQRLRQRHPELSQYYSPRFDGALPSHLNEAMQEAVEATDKTPNMLLLNSLENELVQDPELLDCASLDAVQKLHLAWAESRGLHTQDSPRIRFFIILDDEVVANLLARPWSTDAPYVRHRHHGVKIFDAEYGLSSLYLNGVESESSDDDDDDDEPGDDECDDFEDEDAWDEGWFWAHLDELLDVWCEDKVKGGNEVYTTDEQDRPVRLR
ncbi:hypothetical protein Q7P37_009669 [Cladosporium fusiforme]